MPGVRACVCLRNTYVSTCGSVCLRDNTRIVAFALKVTQGGENVRCGENNLERDRGNPSLAAPTPVEMFSAFLR